MRSALAYRGRKARSEAETVLRRAESRMMFGPSPWAHGTAGSDQFPTLYKFSRLHPHVPVSRLLLLLYRTSASVSIFGRTHAPASFSGCKSSIHMEFFDGKWGSSPAKAAPKPPPNNGKAPQPVALGNMAAAAAAAAAAQRSQHFANAKDVSPELKTPKHMSMPQESLKHVPAYEPRLPSPPPPAEPPKMPWSDFDGKAAWATFRENAVTFDEQVFGCWSERPWRPMAGGASHLKTKKKAASIGRLSAAKSPFLTPGRVTTQPQTSDGAGQQQQQQQVLPPAVPQVQEWVTDADLKQAFKAPGNLCALKIKIRAEQTSSWLATKLSCLPTLSSASDGSAIMTFSLDTTASGRGRFIEDLRTVRRMLEDNEACFVLFCSGGEGR